MPRPSLSRQLPAERGSRPVRTEVDVDELWSMRAVVRRTGISEHTLRAWERRFGFPRPLRLPSGHRRYSTDQVERLQLIASALSEGHRAGEVVPLPIENLNSLLTDSNRRGADAATGTGRWVERMITTCVAFDRDGATLLVRRAAASLGTLDFLTLRVQPVLEEVGDRWSQGRLDIRHEHFISEIFEDELRILRRSLEQPARRHALVLAGLPDEQHGLGLQMVALLAASTGVGAHLLGVRTPVEDIAEAARAVGAAVVGISVGGAAQGDQVLAQVKALRALLPEETELWMGGQGAAKLRPGTPGVRVFDDLRTTAQALSGLAP